jgi:hypothetical protein
MPADHVFARPNGRRYRPRDPRLRARAWENPGYNGAYGVLVLGTLNPDEAWNLAQEWADFWYGDPDSHRLTEPCPGWWRDGYGQRGERTWVVDDDRGRPGVMFTWALIDAGYPFTAGIRPCENEREPDGEPCPGTVTFAARDRQARCCVCGAWMGRLAPGHQQAVQPITNEVTS